MQEKLRNVAIIGATGSVGTSVLDVCSCLKKHIRVWAIAGNSNLKKLLSIGVRFNCDVLALSDRSAAAELQITASSKFKCYGGLEGLDAIIEDHRCEEVVFASSGTETLPALIKALNSGKKVYLANKEVIVAAGEWIMPLAQGGIIPLDSEHNAIWQCLKCEKANRIRKIFLTASGGPFLDMPLEDIRQATFEMAADHPVWPMGKKISVDSATLMNKGIEMIEAKHLFSLPADKIEAIIHPQAYVHGLAEFVDGSVKMLLSRPDMRFAVLSALGHTDRFESPAEFFPSPDFSEMFLHFRLPDEKKFPCLSLAKEACRLGGAYPALLIGADEGAVSLFMEGKIGFLEIAGRIEKILASFTGSPPKSWSESLYLVDQARKDAYEN